MDAATQTARPLPKSYMPEAEKVGLDQRMIYIAESFAADNAGDDDAGWRWLALADVPGYEIEAMRITLGDEFLKSMGFVINE